MAKNKPITFEIHPSGYLKETYANIKHGNGQPIFSSETKVSKQSNLKAIRTLVEQIRKGNYIILEYGLNEQVEKQHRL